MYNTNLNITYNTVDDLSGDTVYRKELLKAFNLDVNGFHILIDNQEKIYNEIKEYSLFKDIMINATRALQKKIYLGNQSWFSPLIANSAEHSSCRMGSFLNRIHI